MTEAELLQEILTAINGQSSAWSDGLSFLSGLLAGTAFVFSVLTEISK
jgi:hypothetical protein